MMGGVRDQFTGTAHPRLLVLLVVGVLIGFLGVILSLATPTGGDAGARGTRLAIVGTLVFLLGASGYLAFAAFERRETG